MFIACALVGQWLPAPANDAALDDTITALQSPAAASLYRHVMNGASIAKRCGPRLQVER